MEKIPLTTFHIIGYFLPGFIFIFSFFIANDHISNLPCLIKAIKELNYGILFLTIILSLIVGIVFDAIRNGIFENILFEKKWLKKWFREMNWNFFYIATEQKVARLYKRYFNYYVFDLNCILSLVFSALVLDKFSSLSPSYKGLVTFIAFVIIVVLLYDARSLREEMADITHDNKWVSLQEKAKEEKGD